MESRSGSMTEAADTHVTRTGGDGSNTVDGTDPSGGRARLLARLVMSGGEDLNLLDSTTRSMSTSAGWPVRGVRVVPDVDGSWAWLCLGAVAGSECVRPA